MPRHLTQEERLRVRGVLHEDLSHESLQTPAELHQVALQWNWDGDDIEPLQWIIRQPQCDQGTALLLYWLAGPRWFCQWSDSPQTLANNRGVGTFNLIAEIEERYAAGFYTQRNIAFDPRHTADWGDLTNNYADLPQVRALPAIMFEPTPGEPVEWERPLYDSFLRRLTDAEQYEINEQLARSLQILRNHTGWIKLDSPPLAIVKTIKAVVYEDCQRHADAAKVSEDEPLLSLGWLWLEQLCRAYQWQWLARDTEGRIAVAAFSPDQAYESHPPVVIRSHIRRCKYEDGIVDLYRLLGQIATQRQLGKAIMRGWVWPNKYSRLVSGP